MMMMVVMELLNMMIGGLSADSDPIVAGDVSKQSRPTLASYTTTLCYISNTMQIQIETQIKQKINYNSDLSKQDPYTTLLHSGQFLNVYEYGQCFVDAEWCRSRDTG